MRIGLDTVAYDWPGGPPAIAPTLMRIARTAEDSGFASLWVMDHLLQLGTKYGTVHGPEDAPVLEGVATLGFLAAATRRIQLGLLVACNLYRPPAVLVKALTSVDVLSRGRTWFGIGAGWYAREARALGFGALPPFEERIGRLEEAIAIAKRMWSDETAAFEGRYYSIPEPVTSPLPLRRPHPPILIGGAGDSTLRLVAREADACNFVVSAPNPAFGVLYQEREPALSGVRERLEFLRAACEEAGRPCDAVEKTMTTYVTVGAGGMTPEEIVEYLAPFAELGISHAMLIVTNAHEIAPLEAIGRVVIPALAGAGPRALAR